MTTKGMFKIVLIFIFSVILNFSSLSQNRKFFVINGKINTETVSSEKCILQIIKNNKQTYTTEVPSNGRFRLELEYNSNYTLNFKQKNFQSKTIQVNTELPSEVLLRPENLTNFQMVVYLLEGNDNNNIQPQQISYSANNDCFIRIKTGYNQEYIEDNDLKTSIIIR